MAVPRAVTSDHFYDAILDRRHVYYFDPPALDRHRYVATWFHDQEIHDFVGAHLHLVNDLTARTYNLLDQKKRPRHDWKQYFFDRFCHGSVLQVVQQLENDNRGDDDDRRKHRLDSFPRTALSSVLSGKDNEKRRGEVVMDREQIARHARDLAATCEKTFGTEADDPAIVDDYLERLGFCVDPWLATTDEAWQLDVFYGEFLEAWEGREAGGDVDDSSRKAAHYVRYAIHLTLELWHEERSLFDEFLKDFSDYATLEELDEYVRQKDDQLISAIRQMAKEYQPQAENEYEARKGKRDIVRALKKRLRDWREGCHAIRAKALRVKDENDGFRVIIEDGLLVDVSGLQRDTKEQGA